MTINSKSYEAMRMCKLGLLAQRLNKIRGLLLLLLGYSIGLQYVLSMIAIAATRSGPAK